MIDQQINSGVTNYLVDATYHESGDEGNDATISVETVGDGTHGVLTHAIANIRTSISTETSAGWLEVNATFDLGQVAAGEISRTTHEFR